MGAVESDEVVGGEEGKELKEGKEGKGGGDTSLEEGPETRGIEVHFNGYDDKYNAWLPLHSQRLRERENIGDTHDARGGRGGGSDGNDGGGGDKPRLSVTVRVYDKDKVGSDDFLGEALVWVGGADEKEQWVPLMPSTDKGTKSGVEVTGDVLVRARLVTEVAAKAAARMSKRVKGSVGRG